jgi:hypothetical protein
MADRRAAYVRFLGASAAYRQGRQRADTSKNEQDKAFEVLAKLTKDASSVGEKEREAAESLAADWVDLNASAAAALPPLTSDRTRHTAVLRLFHQRILTTNWFSRCVPIGLNPDFVSRNSLISEGSRAVSAISALAASGLWRVHSLQRFPACMHIHG